MFCFDFPVQKYHVSADMCYALYSKSSHCVFTSKSQQNSKCPPVNLNLRPDFGSLETISLMQVCFFPLKSELNVLV